MKNQFQVTVNEIVKINRGMWSDAQEIIKRFEETKDLLRVNNSSLNGYVSFTLEKKDLRLKSNYKYWMDQIKESDKLISVMVKWGGWILLIVSQLLQINVMELLQNISDY